MRMKIVSVLLSAAAVVAVPAGPATSVVADKPCPASERWEGDRRCFSSTGQNVALVNLHIQKKQGRDRARAEGWVEEGGAVWMEVRKDG